MERSANSFGKTIVPSVRLPYGLTHGCVRIGHCSLAIRITLVYSDDMMWVLMIAGRFILCGNLNILAVAAGLWVHQWPQRGWGELEVASEGLGRVGSLMEKSPVYIGKTIVCECWVCPWGKGTLSLLTCRGS